MNIDEIGNNLDSNEVFCVKMGILSMWVCAPKHMTLAEVQAGVNQLPPSGTTGGWQVEEKISDNPQFCSPGLCIEDDNRQHWNCYC